MKSNVHKKMTFEDKFHRNYSCVKRNHNSSWSKDKRRNRKLFRLKEKEELRKELEEIA